MILYQPCGLKSSILWQIGWPTSLPTSENEPFVKSVLREKKNALEELMLKSLPLRPRVEDLIDDACNKGIPVIILTAYGRSGEKTARYVLVISNIMLCIISGL
ncbi:hypothetical protein GOBAR_AA25387 [Gossypium barbadense]|uniref:Uncharacterized protein n=2 Tax=Gossypium TaxID=3633 RepID=A0A2P5WW11_GOSBA|nr:hypothetical protein GOBAR_AA25387 [Gossypium barbadense]TYH27184.1 hypothetical protein ES288_A02G049300v1 [Gossypium darwinii]